MAYEYKYSKVAQFALHLYQKMLNYVYFKLIFQNSKSI